MTKAPLKALLALLPVLTACSSGTIDTEDKKGTDLDARLDSQLLSDSAPDRGRAEGGQTLDLPSSPADGPTPAADLQPPPADQGTPGVGGPCPCSNGLFCYNGICFARCTAPTDPCGATSSCQTTERCAELLNPAGTFICLPTGLAVGDVCGEQAFCPNRTICAWYSEQQPAPDPRCLPLCSQVATSCGSSGGQCVSTTDGCLFCSQP